MIQRIWKHIKEYERIFELKYIKEYQRKSTKSKENQRIIFMNCTFALHIVFFWFSIQPCPLLFTVVYQGGVGAEDQAQKESYIEIHQHFPSNRANSRHNKTNEDSKLKFYVYLKIYQTKLSSENCQCELRTENSRVSRLAMVWCTKLHIIIYLLILKKKKEVLVPGKLNYADLRLNMQSVSK